jgi:alpha-1,6-mannosyltransferase
MPLRRIAARSAALRVAFAGPGAAGTVGAGAGRPRALRALPRWAPAALGGIGLAGLVAGGLVVVLDSASEASPRLVPASRAGYPNWMAGVFGRLAGDSAPARFFVVFLAMCFCYLLVLLCARSLSVRVVVAAIVVLHLLFLLAPPLLSRDVFNYMVYARDGPIHGLNPYLHGAGAAPFDEAFRYSCCRHSANPYGPVFTLIGEVLAPLGAATMLWIYKSVMALAALGCVGLVWVCARRLGRDALRAIAFVGLNPVVLVFALGGAHNDVLMELFTLAGIALWLGRREAAGAATATASLAVKLSGAVVVPFMVVASRRKVSAAVAAAATALVLVAIFVLGYGVHAPEGLARAVGQQQSHFYARDVPQELGILLGLGSTPTELKPILNGAFVVLVLFLLWRTWRGADWIAAAGWATLGVLLTSTWLLPWYVVWLLPLAALADDRRLQIAALLFCGYVIWARIPVLGV